MVMMNPVDTKPIRLSTSTLLGQYVRSRSSIERLPSPWGLSVATLRYMGRAANKVISTRTKVATGDSAPAARAAIPGWYPRVEK